MKKRGVSIGDLVSSLLILGVVIALIVFGLNATGIPHRIRYYIQERISPSNYIGLGCIVFENPPDFDQINLEQGKEVYRIKVPSEFRSDLEETEVHLNVRTSNNYGRIRAFMDGKLFTEKYHTQNNFQCDFWERTYCSRTHFIYWPEPIEYGKVYDLDIVVGNAATTICIVFE